MVPCLDSGIAMLLHYIHILTLVVKRYIKVPVPGRGPLGIRATQVLSMDNEARSHSWICGGLGHFLLEADKKVSEGSLVMVLSWMAVSP